MQDHTVTSHFVPDVLFSHTLVRRLMCLSLSDEHLTGIYYDMIPASLQECYSAIARRPKIFPSGQWTLMLQYCSCMCSNWTGAENLLIGNPQADLHSMHRRSFDNANNDTFSGEAQHV